MTLQKDNCSEYISYEDMRHYAARTYIAENDFDNNEHRQEIVDNDIEQEIERKEIEIETHVYNKRRKILEPKGNVCIWCGNHISENSKYYIYNTSIYKKNGFQESFFRKKLVYSQIDIGYPLCQKCNEQYSKAWSVPRLLLLELVAWLISAGAAFLGFYFDTNYSLLSISSLVLVLAILNAAITPLLINAKIKKKILREAKMENLEHDATIKYDFVKDSIANGWSYKKPKPL